MLKTNLKKGQASVGLISGLVFGIASLVVGVIIAFVIVSNVATIDDDLAADIAGNAANESGFVNRTGYTLTQASLTGFASPVITGLWNATTAGAGSYNLSIPIGNATVSSAGIVTNATASNWDDTYISYTYTHTPTVASADLMIGNFTKGIDNVSDKIPTVLLVAAIILILGVLVLLVGTWQRMRTGGGGI